MGNIGSIFRNKSDDEEEEKKSKEPQKDERYDRWGLGLGIDITKPRPWLQKSSFQVRSVRANDPKIIETDQGGLLQAYKEKVHSTATLHFEVKAGAKIPLDVPLNLGLGAEYTRSTLSSKSIKGTKVKNRTLSFRMNFDDVPLPEQTADVPLPEQTADVPRPLPKQTAAEQRCQPSGDNRVTVIAEMEEAEKEVQGATPNTDAAHSDGPFEQTDDFDDVLQPQTASNVAEQGSQPSGDERGPTETEQTQENVRGATPDAADSDRPFDERLCDWLTECCKHRKHTSQTVCTSIEEMVLNHGKCQLKADMSHFVKSVGITHYVSAVQLGAYEYRKVSKKECSKQKEVGENASINALTYGAIETSANVKSTKKRTQEKSEEIKLGRITQGTNKKMRVTKKNEAVIGYQIVPINTLVKNPYLREALRSSLEDYIESQAKGIVYLNNLI